MPDKTAPVEVVLEPIDEILEESLYLWEQCKTTYHDPVKFRANLNSLIQTIRNSTFRIQSQKSVIPRFDEWYLPWQGFLKEYPPMAWINDARVEIVKRKGLESKSSATVRVINSYNKPKVEEFDVNPRMTTGTILKSVADKIPPLHIDFVAIEVTRRWVIDLYPNHEVLETLAECIRVMTAMRGSLQAYLTSGIHIAPREVLDGESPDSALVLLPGDLTIRMKTATGETYSWGTEKLELDLEQAEKARKRYRPGPMEQAQDPADPIEFAKSLAPVALTVLKRDGHHVHLIFLHNSTGWMMHTYEPTSQLDKFLFWQRTAERVKSEGIDGLVYIAEAWIAPLQSIKPSLYPRASESPTRREVLSIYAETADGRVFSQNYPFTKVKGKIQVGQPSSMEGSADFIAPIRRAWSAMQLLEDRQTNVSKNTHSGPGEGDQKK